MDLGWMIAAWLYVAGSAIMWFITMYDHDPWWERTLAVLGWPILFPFAMIFGR